MSSHKKPRIQYTVHHVGGVGSTVAATPSLFADAAVAFNQSHMALVGPSSRTALKTWLSSFLMSGPVTGLIALPIYALLSRFAKGGAPPLLLGAASVGASVGLQYAAIYTYVYRLFDGHLKDPTTSPFVRPAYFAPDKRNTMFLVSTSDDLTKPGASVAGTLVLMVENNELKSPALPPQQSNSGVIRCVGTRPEFHGTGMGSAMLRACLAEARRMGLDDIILHTTSGMPQARRMYEREGFVEFKTIAEAPAFGYISHLYRIDLSKQTPNATTTTD